MKKKYLLMLSAGHVFSDMNQGSLPVILPFLIAAGGLTYAGAAGLTFAVALSSSIVQPIFGLLADKRSMNWLLPFGVLIGCGCISLIGLLHGYYRLMFMVAVISGLGVAAYHPEAARMANHFAGEKKGSGMSIFSVGGNIGFALGPAVMTPAMLILGLSGSLVLAVPAVIMFIIFLTQSSKMKEQVSVFKKEEQSAPSAIIAQKNEWGKFTWLTVAIIGRSIIFHNINTFLPLYLINVMGQSEAVAGSILTVMFIVGAITTLIGGYLTDLFGANKIIRIGWVLLIPSVFLFTRITYLFPSILCIIIIAFGLYMIMSPMIVLGQKYLPGRLGFASGITLGLAVSVGGIFAPLIGSYADAHGLVAALRLLIIVPVAGSVVTITLRSPANNK